MKIHKLFKQYNWKILSPVMYSICEKYLCDYDKKEKKLVTEEDVKNYLDKQVEAYKKVYKYCLDCKPSKNKSNMRVRIDLIKYDDIMKKELTEDEYWYKVNGFNGKTYLTGDKYTKQLYKKMKKEDTLTKEDLECFNKEISWALEYMTFEKWMGYEVDRSSFFKNLDEKQYICNVLWEMTWCGYDNKTIKKRKKDLEELCKQTEKDYKAGKLKTFTVDEFEAQLNKEKDNNE